MSDSSERADPLTSRNDISKHVSKPSEWGSFPVKPEKLNWRIYFEFVHELLIVGARVVIRIGVEHNRQRYGSQASANGGSRIGV